MNDTKIRHTGCTYDTVASPETIWNYLKVNEHVIRTLQHATRLLIWGGVNNANQNKETRKILHMSRWMVRRCWMEGFGSQAHGQSCLQRPDESAPNEWPNGRTLGLALHVPTPSAGHRGLCLLAWRKVLLKRGLRSTKTLRTKMTQHMIQIDSV